MIFKYIKLLLFRTTPMLKDIEGNIAIAMKVKEALIYKSAFLKPPIRLTKLLVISLKIAYIKIIEEIIF